MIPATRLCIHLLLRSPSSLVGSASALRWMSYAGATAILSDVTKRVAAWTVWTTQPVAIARSARTASMEMPRMEERTRVKRASVLERKARITSELVFLWNLSSLYGFNTVSVCSLGMHRWFRGSLRWRLVATSGLFIIVKEICSIFISSHLKHLRVYVHVLRSMHVRLFISRHDFIVCSAVIFDRRHFSYTRINSVF